MSSLWMFFRAECVKSLKGWPLLTAILAPICQTGFLFAIIWFSEDLVMRFRPGFAFWVELNYLAWNLVFLPIVGAIVAELSWELESESKAWNHLLIQPVPRGNHYLAKALNHLSLILMSQMILFIILIPAGMVLRGHLDSILGHTNIWGGIPGNTLIQFAGYSLFASVPLVLFHTRLSVYRPGLGVSIAVALGGTWACARLSGTTSLLQIAPWGGASQAVVFFNRWKRHIPWEYIPGFLLCAAILLLFGTWSFSRNRNV